MLNLATSQNIVPDLPSIEINEGLSKGAFSIIITSNAIPKCSICLNIPNNPVSICNKKQLKISDRHLMCIECAKKYTEKTCPTCRETSTLETTNNAVAEDSDDDNAPTFIYDKKADEFIKTILESSLFICSNSCGSAVAKKNLAEHLLNCKKNNTTINDVENSKELQSYIYQYTEGTTVFKIPMPEYIYEKNRIDKDIKYSFKESKALYLRFCRAAVDFIIYKTRKNSDDNNNKDLIASKIQLELNKENKFIIEEQFLVAYKNINRDFYLSEPTNLRSNFYEPYNKSQKKAWLVLSPDVIYSIAIYPVLYANSPFVHFFEFHASEITALNSMYECNSPDTPDSFIKLKEFFSAKGLSYEYQKIYGFNLEWKIRLAEREIT